MARAATAIAAVIQAARVHVRDRAMAEIVAVIQAVRVVTAETVAAIRAVRVATAETVAAIQAVRVRAVMATADQEQEDRGRTILTEILS